MEADGGCGGGGGRRRSPGPALALRGALMAASGGGKLLAAPYREPGDDGLFVFDCVNAKKPTLGNEGQDGKQTDKGSDDILAFAFSPSGDYFALTDDNKRLILFCTKPSWECVSIRCVTRRCTSLVITAAEDKILVADKSGDVYSYSITEPQADGKLELGHLSLLLDVALSPDDRYILTADRDEKIRISLAKAPYYIVSFCLGHKEFVSKIFVIPNYPDLLLSASGDSTLRLWEYKSGEEVYCCHLSSICGTEAAKTDQKYTVSRITYCSQGGFVAILFDCIPTVYVFQLDAVAKQLVYKQQISLKHKGWDIAFEETGELWMLQEDSEAPLQLYRPCDGQWKAVTDDKGLQKMTKYLKDNWAVFEGFIGAESYYSNLYKASFEDVDTYLQKKEEKLQQKKKKRQDLQHDANGQTKKMKTEESSL
ncbi:tRNA (guanine-N(7)-)-methyltransferase non-catalytic subunit WDR4 [Pezoporus flaviventris]|uniref:tRNA (guanine-N(7)-)-methyltransferase non-catalytic subunit WDR4 n=1 Tax=Pezoporus flaviventris TaxID=889875 RepID=UPI002AB21B70|nr:tRNA (guanine-N(7)-)-methyltransferase non-catalytic subunit WDR4 [Pezoporus flaviventris]